MPPKSKIKQLYACFDRGCNANLGTTGERKIHINEVHGGQVSCPYENCESFLKASYIQRHVNQIHEKKVTKKPCSRCGRLISNYKMNLHLKGCCADKLKNFRCLIDDCQSVFAVERGLCVHVKNVHEPPMKCPREGCDAYFEPSKLSRHMKTVHEKLKESCPNCGKQISYGHLSQHVQRCTSDGEKKISCTFQDCDAKFTTLNNRSTHISHCHTKSPIKCPRNNCNVILHPYTLSRHIKEAHDKIKIKCEFCEQEFARKYNFKKHLVYCRLVD